MKTSHLVQENTPFKHKVKSIFFFILALNAAFLLYLLCDQNRIFASIATAKIAHTLEGLDSKNTEENSAAERGSAQKYQAADAGSQDAPSQFSTEPKKNQQNASAKALSMTGVSPMSTTGACYALDSFRSEIQMQSAKALIASGPLREKSWAVTTPISAMFISGIETANLSEASKTSQMLSAKGIEPISMSAKFVAVARADNEANAQELGNEALYAIEGAKVKTKQIAAASEKKALVVLAQTRAEIQTVNSMSNRLPGSHMSPIACPQSAQQFLNKPAQ